jgi:hypothetical protein
MRTPLKSPIFPSRNHFQMIPTINQGQAQGSTKRPLKKIRPTNFSLRRSAPANPITVDPMINIAANKIDLRQVAQKISFLKMYRKLSTLVKVPIPTPSAGTTNRLWKTVSIAGIANRTRRTRIAGKAR